MKAMLAASSPNAATTTSRTVSRGAASPRTRRPRRGARPEQQRHDAFLRPDQLRRVAVRRFDGGKEATRRPRR